ncbi:E2-like conjugating enzyme atg10 [Mactra antiquata]
MSLGVISEEECFGFMEDFVQRSKKSSEPWDLMEHGGKLYIYLKSWKVLSNQKDHSKVSDNSSDRISEPVETETDHTICSDEFSNACILFEYYVIYSESYSVPVLYFNVYNSNGGLVSLSDVWDLVPAHYKERLEENRWTFITQSEHPYLGRPYYQLHPCHTATLMKDVTSMTSSNACSNYLLSWLSAVGPVVLLSLPLTLASDT